MEWWEDFFDEDMGRILFPPERMRQTSAECDLIEDVLGLRKGDSVLDLACGIGRHSIELAKRGYEVTGIDISPVYLAKARKAAQGRKSNVEFLKSDMRFLPFACQFDAVICMFTSFGFFLRETDHVRTLKGIERSLRPEGRVLIDVISRDYLEAHFKAKDWTQHEDGLVVLEDQRLDKRRGRTVSTWTMIKGKKRKSYTHTLRVFTLPELSRLAGRAGLRIAKAYGGYSKEQVGPNARRLVTILKKK